MPQLFGDFYRANTASLTATNSSFVPLFNNDPSLSGSVYMGSASAEFQSVVTFVHRMIGEPVLLVELTPENIASCLESAIFRFSSIVMSYFIQSYVAQLLGLKISYTEYDFQHQLPIANNAFFDSFIESQQQQNGLYNPNTEKRKGYIDFNPLEQTKDIFSYGKDSITDLPIDEYVASVSGVDVHFTEIYHGPAGYVNRMYDPMTNQQFLNAEFGMPTYPADTVFYVLPLWQEIARGQLLSANDQVRKSAYMHHIYGRNIELIPRPKDAVRIWFDFYVKNDATQNKSPLQQSSFSGLSYLAASAQNVATHYGNVPVKDITYDTMNPIGRAWVREYTLALALRTLGFIRGKFPITLPGGETISLNHDALFSESRDIINKLETELKEHLGAMDSYEILKKEAEKANLISDMQIKNMPFAIYRTKGY